MAALSLHLFENIENEQAFIERRFQVSVSFMSGCNQTQYESSVVKFGVYRVKNTKTYAAVRNTIMSDALRDSLNLELVRDWSLVRRGANVFFVGECSEAIIADNVVPLDIRVKGGQDAERCWSRA